MRRHSVCFYVFVMLFLLFILPTTAYMQDKPNQPLPVPTEALNSPLYRPGAYREFRSSVIFTNDGKHYNLPTKRVQPGQIGTQTAYTNGIFRGDSVLWFSGNWAAGHGESKLTQPSSLRIYTCARVVDFHADNGGSSLNTGYTCDYRTAANSTVTSTDVSTWSGCSIVYFSSSAPKISSNLTYHTFNSTTGAADSQVRYGCSL